MNEPIIKCPDCGEVMNPVKAERWSLGRRVRLLTGRYVCKCGKVVKL